MQMQNTLAWPRAAKEQFRDKLGHESRATLRSEHTGATFADHLVGVCWTEVLERTQSPMVSQVFDNPKADITPETSLHAGAITSEFTVGRRGASSLVIPMAANLGASVSRHHCCIHLKGGAGAVQTDADRTAMKLLCRLESTTGKVVYLSDL